jgi:para-aminobenzoate synthetase component I
LHNDRQKVYTCAMKGDPNPYKIIDKLVERYSGQELILLESQMPEHPESVCSYLAAGAKRSIQANGDSVTVSHAETVQQFKENPWSAFRKFQDESEGMIFGYLGYDLKNYTEQLFSTNKTLTNLPDLWFFEPEHLIQIDEAGAHIVKGGLEADASDSEISISSCQVSSLRPLISHGAYLQKIREIQTRIHEGDFYELNYSYPIQGMFEGAPYQLYRRMRDINPVPFAAYLDLKEATVCCSSPERFLKKSGRRVISEPIKGTVPRSDHPDEEKHHLEILNNEKNRAENLMIVDLVRHDLSSIALPGSVTVPKLYDIQSFGTVHQLISTVEAEVDENCHPADVIQACFPMGSMTGAPKIEVMKTIEQLETYRRGIYSGAIGYITPDGDFDFNVVIRSAIIQDGTILYPVGGAITGDSDPEDEWIETQVKARSLTRAI